MTAGTPMYAAPELMKVRVNSRTDAKATDSYSLGVVIYELLTRTQRDQGMNKCNLCAGLSKEISLSHK